jgi:hypothetical protein
MKNNPTTTKITGASHTRENAAGGKKGQQFCDRGEIGRHLLHD